MTRRDLYFEAVARGIVIGAVVAAVLRLLLA